MKKILINGDGCMKKISYILLLSFFLFGCGRNIENKVEINSSSEIGNKLQEDIKNKEIEKKFDFILNDIALDGESLSLIEKSYNDIINEFGDPIEIKDYKVRSSGSIDYYENYYKLIYKDIEFIFMGEENKLPVNENVLRFYIKTDKYTLKNGLKCNLSIQELKKMFPNVQDITKDSEKSYLKEKAILTDIIDNEVEYNFLYLSGIVNISQKGKEEILEIPPHGTSALGLVLLIKNEKIVGITNIYPTAS